MKKIILITTMCLFSITLLKAQNRNSFQKTLSVNDNFKQSNKTVLKNSKGMNWNWDTIITYTTQDSLSFLFSRTYDNSGNILTDKRDLWKNNIWNKDDAYTYSYNNGKIITSTYKSWFNNILSEYKQDSNIYNSNGDLISTIIRDLLYNVNYFRYTCSYNTNGKKSVELYEIWQNNAWVNSVRQTYTYDLSGNNLSNLKETWVNNTWHNSNRYTYIYDLNGNLLSELFEIWSNALWVNSSKSTYTYNSNHNMLTDSIQYWVVSINSWKFQERNFYTYNINGILQNILHDIWYNNTWLTKVKTSNSYNINGDLISLKMDNWQDTIWVNSYKQTYNYDLNGNSTYGKQENWSNNNWNLCLYSILNIFTKNDIYQLSAFPAYYKAHFISYSTIINEIKQNSKLKIFPNPATTQTTITYPTTEKGTTLQIYNIIGQRIYEEKLAKGSIQTSIDTRTYKKGLYKVLVGESSGTLVVTNDK